MSLPARRWFGAVSAFGLMLAAAPSGAAPDSNDEIWKGIFSSFDTPLTRFLDGTADESLSLRLSFDLPLKAGSEAPAGSGRQGEPGTSPTVTVGFKYVPLTAWFLSMNFTRYLKPERQFAWHPDFTYVFGYDDWRPYTLSLQYANFGGNRLSPDRSKGEVHTRFNEGTWSLGFKFPMPSVLEPYFLVGQDHVVGCNTAFNYTPRYADLASNSTLRGKRTLSLGCKYGLPNNWYATVAITHHLKASQQQPWNGDYTYGFGYFDWRPGSWSIQYNNYSGNRFPWRKRVDGTGRLRDGSLSLSTSRNFL
ncbi:MAG: hypothetical protein RJA10_273 [Pseudomonadota bacterium]|jgi:hypothetical protein